MIYNLYKTLSITFRSCVRLSAFSRCVFIHNINFRFKTHTCNHHGNSRFRLNLPVGPLCMDWLCSTILQNVNNTGSYLTQHNV